MILRQRGCPELEDPQSVMGYDRPAALAQDGEEAVSGGSHSIDEEARALLRSLYPLLIPDVYCSRWNAPEMDGFRAGWDGGANGSRWIGTTQTANIIAGLCRVHMGLNGNFRLNCGASEVVPGVSFRLNMGTWADTHLIDASCNVLSFNQEDKRVRTGRLEWHELAGSNQQRSVRVKFSPPFEKTPNVIVAISKFDTNHGAQIRCQVRASDIGREGCTIVLETWAGKWHFRVPPLSDKNGEKVTHPFNRASGCWKVKD
jgi:hypothetical protein